MGTWMIRICFLMSFATILLLPIFVHAFFLYFAAPCFQEFAVTVHIVHVHLTEVQLCQQTAGPNTINFFDNIFCLVYTSISINNRSDANRAPAVLQIQKTISICQQCQRVANKRRSTSRFKATTKLMPFKNIHSSCCNKVASCVVHSR